MATYDPEQLPHALEADVRLLGITRNLTSFVGAGNSSGWQLATSVGDLVPFRLELITDPKRGQPNPEGFATMNITATLVRMATSVLTLSVAAMRSYNIDEDETIALLIDPSAYSTCRPPSAVVIATLRVVADEESAIVVTRAASSAVTAGAYTTDVLGGVAAAAADVQALAVVGMMSCSQPVERRMASNYRLIAPTALSDTFAGMLLGSAFLLIPVLVVHTSVYTLCCVAANLNSPFRRFDWLNEVKADPAASARFPALSILLSALLHQGMLFSSVQLVALAATSMEVWLGSCGILFCLALPIVAVAIVDRRVSSTFRLYDVSSLKAQPLTVMNFLRIYIMPLGLWEPAEVRHAFGPLFSSFRRAGLVWVTFPYWQSFAMGAASGFHPTSAAGCHALFLSLAVFEVVLAAVSFTMWPSRSRVSDALAGASTLCLAVVLECNGVLSVNATSAFARNLLMVATFVMLVISALRVLYMLLVRFVEERLMDGVPRIVEKRVVGRQYKVGRLLAPASDEEEEESDIELCSSAVPTLSVPLIDPTKVDSTENPDGTHFVFSAPRDCFEDIGDEAQRRRLLEEEALKVLLDDTPSCAEGPRTEATATQDRSQQQMTEDSSEGQMLEHFYDKHDATAKQLYEEVQHMLADGPSGQEPRNGREPSVFGGEDEPHDKDQRSRAKSTIKHDCTAQKLYDDVQRMLRTAPSVSSVVCDDESGLEATPVTCGDESDPHSLSLPPLPSEEALCPHEPSPHFEATKGSGAEPLAQLSAIANAVTARFL